MKNLHQLSIYPDKLWALSSWLNSFSFGTTTPIWVVKIENGEPYRRLPTSNKWQHLFWNEDSWQIVLNEWYLRRSPKTEQLRATFDEYNFRRSIT